MIAELLLFPLLFLLFTGWGLWAQTVFRLRTDSLAILTILGMAFFGTIATVLAFFIPLAEPVEIILAIIGFISFCFSRIRKQLPRVELSIFGSLWFWLFAVLTLSGGAFYAFRNDYFWYYLPSFRWLNEFGLVRGTANIDWVIGQMSLFHVVQATLDQTFDMFGRLGVFITIVYLLYIFERKSWLLLIFAPFYFLFFQVPSPDLPLVFVSLIVVNELCFFERKSEFGLLFALAVFVFVVKPVAFWLPLWVVVCGFRNDKKEVFLRSKWWMPTLTVAVFIVKNVIVSSCIVYPATATLLNTWWAPDRQMLELSEANSSLYSFDLYYEEEQVAAFSTAEKIVRFLTLPDPSTLLNYVMFLTVLVFGWIAFRGSRKLSKRFIYKALFIIAVLKITLIYYISAQYRFVVDVFYPILFILLSIKHLSQRIVLRVSGGLFLFAYLFIAFPEISGKIYPRETMMGSMKGITALSFLRPDNYIFQQYRTEQIGNMTLNISTELNYNFDTPPPAVTTNVLKRWYFMNILPQWKNPDSPHDGLIVRPLAPDEKAKIKRVVLEIERVEE
jgi:hypothetical protein